MANIINGTRIWMPYTGLLHYDYAGINALNTGRNLTTIYYNGATIKRCCIFT